MMPRTHLRMRWGFFGRPRLAPLFGSAPLLTL